MRVKINSVKKIKQIIIIYEGEHKRKKNLQLELASLNKLLERSDDFHLFQSQNRAIRFESEIDTKKKKSLTTKPLLFCSGRIHLRKQTS